MNPRIKQLVERLHGPSFQAGYAAIKRLEDLVTDDPSLKIEVVDDVYKIASNTLYGKKYRIRLIDTLARWGDPRAFPLIVGYPYCLENETTIPDRLRTRHLEPLLKNYLHASPPKCRELVAEFIQKAFKGQYVFANSMLVEKDPMLRGRSLHLNLIEQLFPHGDLASLLAQLETNDLLPSLDSGDLTLILMSSNPVARETAKFIIERLPSP